MAKFLSILAVFIMWEGAANAAETELGKQSPGQQVVTSLRERGPDGLAEALRVYDGLLLEQSQRRYSCAAPPKEQAPDDLHNLDAWRAAIDQIGGARGCSVSRLYWYTDLAEAKAAAARTRRPILSLRLLGKLTDEFSCANSRFFRTALYSNKEISDYLRGNFILHWQSERPVPRVTIDFGDGRKLERTVTGNSAHYVLASDGAPMDVLPGLYGPQQFLQWLRGMRDLHETWRQALQAKAAPNSIRTVLLKGYHENRHNAILTAWNDDLQRLGKKQMNLVSSRIDDAMAEANRNQQPAQQVPAPRASAAAGLAVTKSNVERPLLRFTGFDGPWLEKAMDVDLWKAIASLHRNDVHLDESSVKVIRKEFPNAAVAGAILEDPMLRMVSTFENSIALDEVRNEYLLHRQIHERLAASENGTMDFDALNEWVYAKLFLTPSKDPWLGLASSDVYSALDWDGRAEAAGPHGD